MFWPEVGELEYQGIASQAEAIARKTAKFSLAVTGIGTFGERGRDAVLFFTVAFSPDLALLKKACPWTDRREFHPHITLARIRHPERFAIVKKRVLKHVSNAAFSIPCEKLRLYGNVGGKKQTPLQDALFAG
jgi:2'-5' RNA ligase